MYKEIVDEQGRVWRDYKNSGSEKRKSLKSASNNKNNIQKDKDSLVKAFLKGEIKQVMTLEIPFKLCLSVFNTLYHNSDILSLKSDFDNIYGVGYCFSYSDLSFRKSRNNKSTYYYFDRECVKEKIRYKCLASFILCLLSYAVELNKMTKTEYKEILKNQLKNYVNIPKKIVQRKGAKKKNIEKRQWVSVISVPFGGMNKKY